MSALVVRGGSFSELDSTAGRRRMLRMDREVTGSNPAPLP
jgi:hypothetical protein